MFWRASYDTGEIIEESDGGYARLDRQRINEFSLWADSLQRVLAVPVNTGDRLIYRRRTLTKPGSGQVTLWLVALEREDLMKLWLILPDKDGCIIEVRDSYGSDAFSAAPQLLPHEVMK